MRLRLRRGAGAAPGSSIPKSKSSSFGARFATFGGWLATAGILLAAKEPLRSRAGCRFGRGTAAATARLSGEVPNVGFVSVEPGFGSVTSETLGAALAALGVTLGTSGAGGRALGEGAGRSRSSASASCTGATGFDSSDAPKRSASASTVAPGLAAPYRHVMPATTTESKATPYLRIICGLRPARLYTTVSPGPGTPDAAAATAPRHRAHCARCRPAAARSSFCPRPVASARMVLRFRHFTPSLSDDHPSGSPLFVSSGRNVTATTRPAPSTRVRTGRTERANGSDAGAARPTQGA
jgi:hypothetical protein